jgi:cathepsin D
MFTYSSTLIGLLLVSHAALAGATQILDLSLKQRSPTRWNVPRSNLAADNLRVKYGYPHRTRELEGRAQPGSLALVDVGIDSAYIATVSFGTPPQNFEVVLDTGSIAAWVAGKNCSTCDPEIPKFSTKNSSTFHNTGKEVPLAYGSGSMTGTLARDAVSIAGLKTSKQPFLVANGVDDVINQLFRGFLSGIIGLGFPDEDQKGLTPLWLSLASNGKLAAKTMSFFMARHIDDPTVGNDAKSDGGVFTMGGTNSSYYKGDIEYLELANKTRSPYWLLPVKNITAQGKVVKLNASEAAIDTGTTLIGGPTDAVKAIWSKVKGSKPHEDMPGFFTFPCKTEVSVSLSFGGKSWPINPTDMNLGPYDEKDTKNCLGGIFDLGGGSTTIGSGLPAWIIGDTFLKNVYSVFRADPLSVGFAELSEAAVGAKKSSGKTSAKFGKLSAFNF